MMPLIRAENELYANSARNELGDDEDWKSILKLLIDLSDDYHKYK